MSQFIHGAVVMASLTIGLFFLRYWRATKDRLFLLFCLAFWLLALNWTLVALAGPLSEHAYIVRFLGFVVIASAVLDKNRRQKARL
jgi:hypothetical protein